MTLLPSIHHKRNMRDYFLTILCTCLNNSLNNIYVNINFDFWSFLYICSNSKISQFLCSVSIFHMFILGMLLHISSHFLLFCLCASVFVCLIIIKCLFCITCIWTFKRIKKHKIIYRLSRRIVTYFRLVPFETHTYDNRHIDVLKFLYKLNKLCKVEKRIYTN